MLLVLLGSALLLSGCDATGPDGRPPATKQVFGTENYDAGLDLLETPEGVVVAGTGNGVLAPADGTVPTPNLTRLGTDGRVRWSRLYDDLQGGKLLAVRQSGSGYAVLIRTGILTGGEDRLRLAAVGPGGRRRRTLYERPGTTAHSNQTLRRTRDGGFILAGATPYGEEPRHAFLIRLSADGRVRWERSFEKVRAASAVVETTEGDFVLIGEAGSEAPSHNDILLINVSRDGSVQWRRTYGTEKRQERGLAMASTEEGGVVVAGQSSYYGEEASEEWAYALRVAPDGTKRWSATYDGEAEHATQAITALRDGGFVLAGRRRAPEGETDVLLIRISGQGEQQWRQTFGEEGRIDQANAVSELRDGRLAITGATGPDEPSFGGADFDVFVRFVSPDTSEAAP